MRRLHEPSEYDSNIMDRYYQYDENNEANRLYHDRHSASGSRASDADQAAFTRYNTTPRAVYFCHVATRLIIALCGLLALLFICISYGVVLARLVLLKPRKFSTMSFDIFMWKLEAKNAKTPSAIRLQYAFNAHSRNWMNGSTRVVSILALICAIVALTLSVVFFAYVFVNRRGRQKDDAEREYAVQEDRRTYESLLLEEQERDAANYRNKSNNNTTTNKNKNNNNNNDSDNRERTADRQTSNATQKKSKRSGSRGDSDRSGNFDPDAIANQHERACRRFTSCMKPGSYYAEREHDRRQTDFSLGVSVFIFTFLTFLFSLVAFIVCAVWVHGDGFVDSFDDLFDDIDADVDDDDIEDNGVRTLQAGFYMLLVAFIAALVAMILTVIPPIAGWSLAGPQRVVPDRHDSDDKNKPQQPLSARGRSPRNGNDDSDEEMDHRQRPVSPFGDQPENSWRNGGGGGGYYYPQPPQQTQQPQQAVRGIPMALPGPPVDTLNIVDDTRANGNNNSNGNNGNGNAKGGAGGYAHNFSGNRGYGGA